MLPLQFGEEGLSILVAPRTGNKVYKLLALNSSWIDFYEIIIIS